MGGWPAMDETISARGSGGSGSACGKLPAAITSAARAPLLAVGAGWLFAAGTAAGVAPIAVAAATNCDVLLLDLEGDGLFLTDRFYSVQFDFGHGAETTSWTAPGVEEAFLWFDGNGDGEVTSVGELVGSCFAAAEIDGEAAAVVAGDPAVDGFARLAQFDRAAAGGNENGRFDGEDELWARLRLWVDRDHDAAVDVGETAELEAWQLVEIGLEAMPTRKVDGGLNRHHRRGTYQRDVGERRGVPEFLLGTVTAVLFDRPALVELPTTPAAAP